MRDATTPSSCPEEIRQNGIAATRTGESDINIEQIATGFGISESMLQNWRRKADVEDGNRHGQTAAVAAEPRELLKRNRLFEQANEILRQALHTCHMLT